MSIIVGGNWYSTLPQQKMIEDIMKLNHISILSLLVSAVNNKKSVALNSRLQVFFSPCLKVKIWHYQFYFLCICLLNTEFFLIWWFWPSKCFYHNLTLFLSRESDHRLPLKISTLRKLLKPVTQKQYGVITIPNIKELIFNLSSTHKLFLAQLLFQYPVNGGLVMLDTTKRLSRVCGILTLFNHSFIGVVVIVPARLSKMGKI